MKVEKIDVISNKDHGNQSNNNSRRKSNKEPKIEYKKERGFTSTGVREACGNCRHKIGGSVCLHEFDYDNPKENWCELYEYHGDPLSCNTCELKDRCSSTTRAEGCVKVNDKHKREKRIEELAETGELIIKK